MEAVINEFSVINSDHALAADEETELKKYSVNPWQPVDANSPYASVVSVRTYTTITNYPCLHQQHNGSSPTIVPCGWGGGGGDTTQSLPSSGRVSTSHCHLSVSHSWKQLRRCLHHPAILMFFFVSYCNHSLLFSCSLCQPPPSSVWFPLSCPYLYPQNSFNFHVCLHSNIFLCLFTNSADTLVLRLSYFHLSGSASVSNP